MRTKIALIIPTLLFFSGVIVTFNKDVSGIPANVSWPDSTQESTSDSVYTCTMHPEVIQNEPGTCTVCGMELVLTASKKEEEKHDIKSGEHEQHKNGHEKHSCCRKHR